MVTLFITRHGQTEWNLQKRMQGWFDSPLTTQGKQAACALGKRLSNEKFNAIYSSPSGRAVDTAKLICNERQIPIFFKQQLKEINTGDWQGMTENEIQEEYPLQFKKYYEDPQNFTLDDSESFQDVLDRSLQVIHDICERYEENDKVLIVTHGVVKKLLIAHFNNLSLNNVWDPPFIHGTSLTIVKMDKEKNVEITMVGDTTHIPSDAMSY